MRPLAALLAALVGLGVGTACSSGSTPRSIGTTGVATGPSPIGTASIDNASSGTGTAPGGGERGGSRPAGVILSPFPLLPASQIPNVPARRNGVLVKSCRSQPGGWRAGGTARNVTNTTTRYRITVFFTSARATVLSYASAGVTVPAGTTRRWQVGARFDAPGAVRCVLRGVA